MKCEGCTCMLHRGRTKTGYAFQVKCTRQNGWDARSVETQSITIKDSIDRQTR